MWDSIGCVEMTLGGGQFAHLKKASRIQIISYFVFFSTSFYSCITALAFFYTNKVVTLCHLCNFSFFYLPLCSLFGTIKMNFVKKKINIYGMKLQKDTKRNGRMLESYLYNDLQNIGWPSQFVPFFSFIHPSF